MDLQDIDMRTQPLDAPLDGVEDVLPAEADFVDHCTVVRGHGSSHGLRVVFCHAHEAFGEDYELVAGNGILLDRFADDAFAVAVGVDVCGLFQQSTLADTLRLWLCVGRQHVRPMC